MFNLTKHVSTILSMLIAALIIALAFATLDPPAAQGHVAKASSCDLVWQAADVGEKWPAKQRCLAAVQRHNCVTHGRPVPGSVTVKGEPLRRGGSAHWRNQREVIEWIVVEGIRRNLPQKVVVSAIATTTQESSARELDHGHGTSLGPFQLINLHGPAAQRRSIEFSGTWYYNGAIRTYRRNPSLSVVELSHAVQRSAHPTAVARWIPEARRTLGLVLGPCRLPRR
jgi:hypothetical protein